ncbi:outer membrane protein assembly factor BamE [Sulfitobacter aestuarii]|uniref:Outer membrane protein assembly factor BamE n=1 Tax=Sulfitobacter aestuarii TaxID=2161676 RepID=A0ABW5U0P1_9RHOB
MCTRSRVNPRILGTIVLGAVLSLSACAPQYKNYGYIPPEDQLERIRVGVDTRESVTETVGAPVASGVLEGSGYYYVRSRQRALGFLAPEEVEREVVAISFSDAGVVNNVERFGLERGRVVVLERRVTSAPVGSNSPLRKLLSNIGRLGPAGLGE